MAESIETIADGLGAEVIGRVPEAGGGAFGAARLAGAVAELRARLRPGRGLRPGRPSDPSWTMSPKVPMSPETHERLARLAELASDGRRKVTPMQMAAQLLERAALECGAAGTPALREADPPPPHA